MKKNIYLRFRKEYAAADGEVIEIDEAATCVTIPAIISGEPGIGQVRFAFSGERSPSGIEIWTEGGAVLRDIKWKLDHPQRSNSQP